MSYRLVDANKLALKYPEVNDMPCIYADLPNGLDGKHYTLEMSHKGHWIKVNERLPEEAFGCLVTILDTDLRTQDEFENILPYTVGYDGETWNNFCGEPIPFEVVAWMKLPEPYKADMKGDTDADSN